MNELDDAVAKLFAKDESIADDGAFATAVHRRVAYRRRSLRALKIGLTAAPAAAATALFMLAPGALGPTALAIERLISSPLIAVLACAVMVWWNLAEET